MRNIHYRHVSFRTWSDPSRAYAFSSANTFIVIIDYNSIGKYIMSHLAAFTHDTLRMLNLPCLHYLWAFVNIVVTKDQEVGESFLSWLYALADVDFTLNCG